MTPWSIRKAAACKITTQVTKKRMPPATQSLLAFLTAVPNLLSFLSIGLAKMMLRKTWMNFLADPVVLQTRVPMPDSSVTLMWMEPHLASSCLWLLSFSSHSAPSHKYFHGWRTLTSQFCQWVWELFSGLLVLTMITALSICVHISWDISVFTPSWITALSRRRGLHNSMKLWAMPGRVTQDRWVIAVSSNQTWSTAGGNGKPPQYTCRENLMNCIKAICRVHHAKCLGGWITSWNQDSWEKY